MRPLLCRAGAVLEFRRVAAGQCSCCRLLDATILSSRGAVLVQCRSFRHKISRLDNGSRSVQFIHQFEFVGDVPDDFKVLQVSGFGGRGASAFLSLSFFLVSLIESCIRIAVTLVCFRPADPFPNPLSPLSSSPYYLSKLGIFNSTRPSPCRGAFYRKRLFLSSVTRSSFWSLWRDLL